MGLRTGSIEMVIIQKKKKNDRMRIVSTCPCTCCTYYFTSSQAQSGMDQNFIRAEYIHSHGVEVAGLGSYVNR